jgi:hypothetical protein
MQDAGATGVYGLPVALLTAPLRATVEGNS